MAGTAVQIKVDVSQLQLKLARALQAFNPRVLLKAIGEAQVSWVMRNFVRDGALVGGWEPLSPNTVAGRRKGSSKPLQDTGALKRSAGTYEVIGNDTVRTGSNLEYASYHNDGVPGPYEIKAKNVRWEYMVDKNGHRRLVRKGALRFMTVDGPKFSISVMHPGIPQRRFLPNEVEIQKLVSSLIEAKIRQAGA